MNILFISQYFYPENNARSFRIGFFSKFLANNGFKVSVICQTPNYPKGVIFKGYKNKLVFRERIDNVNVIRSWVWVSKKKNFLNRSLNYFSFFLSSILASFKIGKTDLVFASAPPVFVLFSGFIVSKIKRALFVIDVGDFWPDSVVALGLMKKNFIFRLIEKLEKYVYKKSVLIIVNSNRFVDRLTKEKGVKRNKIKVLLNGAELNLFRSYDNLSLLKLKREYNIEDKFVVLYAGLLGLAQSPEVLVETARVLKDYKNIVFLIVGGGVLKERCENLARKYNLKNIIFVGEKPRKEIPNFTGISDLAIIPYKNLDFFKDNVPSKIFDYMAAGLPIIINLDGEGANIIKKAKCGLIAKPENPESLAEKILNLYNKKEKAKTMGKNAKKYAEENFDKRKIAKDLLDRLSELIK